MAQVEKVSVALTAEMAEMVRAAVASGEYASASEVIREALRAWKLERELRQREIEILRRLWQEGLDSGPGRDGAEAFARLRRRHAPAAADAGG